MNPQSYAIARDIFHEAIDLPAPERFAFVDQRAPDESVRQEVLSLLSYHDAAVALDEAQVSTGKAAVISRCQDHRDSGSELAAPSPCPAQALRGARKRRNWLNYLPVVAAIILVVPLLSLLSKSNQRISQGFQESQVAVVRASLSDAVNRLLQWSNRQTVTAQSWAAHPELLKPIQSLVDDANQGKQRRELLLANPARQTIDRVMTALGGDDLRYVFWDRAGTTLASWQADGGDVGYPVTTQGSFELGRALAGQTVIHHPDRLLDTTEGFQPETLEPVMWLLTPVLDEQGKTMAVMLIRKPEFFDQFNQILHESCLSATGETYAVDSQGVLRSSVRHTPFLRQAGIIPADATTAATHLRIGTPGGPLLEKQLSRTQFQVLPLTIAASHLVQHENGHSSVPYRDYRGEEVIGAWQWVPELDLGIISEFPSEIAFAPLRLLRWTLFFLSGVTLVTAVACGQMLSCFLRGRTSVESTAFGQYEILEQLGSGGMGVVYRAKHQWLKRQAALKVIRPDQLSDEMMLRFDREVQQAARLCSPHSVSVFDYGWTDQRLAYCAMELLSGMTMHHAVQRSGPQPPGRVIHFLIQLCDSLAEAHGLGLVHRDVKPRNIMISFHCSRKDWAVLFDFGLAKPMQPDGDVFMTRERIWAGTPMFMAPERFRNPAVLDPRSDLYSLGAVAYFMLAGVEPFSEIDPSGMFELILSSHPEPLDERLNQPELKALAELIQCCMEKDPADRPQSADELQAALMPLSSRYPWDREQAKRWWEQFG